MRNNRYAFALLFALFATCFAKRSVAQVSIVVDTPACGVYSTTLHGTNLGSVPYSTGLSIDDIYSGVVPIGFTYNHYGNNYTQLIIASNGYLCFNTALAGTYSPWSISAPLLGNASVYNSVCGPWSDIYAAFGGVIEYSTVGTAPFRKFICTWCRTAMFSCTTLQITSQIILYETTNVAEVHLARKPTCAWNSNYAIIGVQNATGTAATPAPGRDFPTAWTVTTPEAWRFTPDVATAPTSYTCSTIPYSPIPYASSSITWYDSTTGAYLGTGPTLPIAPTVPTTYVGVTVGCYDSTRTYIHVDPATLFAAGGDIITGVSSTNPTDCGRNDGTIRLTGHITPGVLDTVFYTLNGVPQPGRLFTAAADSSITITGLLAGPTGTGVYSDIWFHGAGYCPSNHMGPITITDPTVNANFSYYTRLGCEQDTLFVLNSSTNTAVAPGTYTSVFSYGDGMMDSSSFNPMHIYTTQGTYNVTLQYHSQYYYTNNALSCMDVVTFPVTFSHTVTSVFTPSAPVVCLGVPVSFTNTSVGGGATYLWTFGDGSTATDMNPTHTYVSPGTYSVTLTVTDTIPCQAVSGTTIEVQSITTHTEFHDTIVCLKTPMPLHSYTETVANSSAYVTYLWTPGTYLSDPTSSDPDFMAVGDYTYTLTATLNPLGCTASDVLTIHSNPPITLTHVTTDRTIPYGSSVQLNADSAWVYVWAPNDGTLDNPNINNPVATPTDSVTTYMVIGMSPYGCRDTAYVTIRVGDGSDEFIPEAFTPNGDGLNDQFRVFNMRYQKLVDFRVFNRWGREVFHTIDPKTGWDGTYNGVPQDMGTYFYQAIVAHPDGVQKTYNGTVTLIR